MVLNWHLQQVDIIMPYTQATVECDMYMRLPAGIEVEGGEAETHILKLVKNLYGEGRLE